ncbi:MAG TPA: hypothetical protein VFU02_11770, partial [Polyangiaceae bacterium]|nr:hypothetical protein [Polyangiaceae bacterium]
DREYQRPDHGMRLLTYQRCLADETCKAELERLDQRHAIGSSLSCVSWAGVVDLNGNVNEWVRRPHKEPPNRSGLKGGWWGPVRNRCRPTVGFHKEFDYGYEAGFRCCKGLGPESPDPRYEAERFRISPEQLEARKAEQEALEAVKGLQLATSEPARSDARLPNQSRASESGEASRSTASGDALEPALSAAAPASSSPTRQERKPPAASSPSAVGSPSALPPASPPTSESTPAPAPPVLPPGPRRDAPAPAPSSAPPSSASAR